MRNLFMTIQREQEASARRHARQERLQACGRLLRRAAVHLIYGALVVTAFFTAQALTKNEDVDTTDIDALICRPATKAPKPPQPDPAWHGYAINPLQRT